MRVKNVSNEVIRIYVDEGKLIKNQLEPGQTIELSIVDAKWNALNYYGLIEILDKVKEVKPEEEDVPVYHNPEPEEEKAVAKGKGKKKAK